MIDVENKRTLYYENNSIDKATSANVLSISNKIVMVSSGTLSSLLLFNTLIFSKNLIFNI